MPDPLEPLVPAAADEGPHEHSDHVLWSESHYLDAVASEPAAAAYFRITGGAPPLPGHPRPLH